MKAPISNTKIEPHKITRPIQLLAMWFAVLVLIEYALLTTAGRISTPPWITPMLSIAAVFFVPTFLVAAFIMLTKFRPHLQDDQHYSQWLERHEAKEYVEYVPPPTENRNLKEIRYSEQSDPIILTAHNEEDLLFLKARIHYSHEAGSIYLMKIRVNGEFLREKHLINKPPIKKIMDGRERPWFSGEYDSWAICYSPDFKANYFHTRYKVINGDPYIFIFDLSRIQKKEGNEY